MLLGTLLMMGAAADARADDGHVARPAIGKIYASPLSTGVKALDRPLNISFCIFDPMGNQGDIYSYAKDLAVEGRKWNVFAELKPYTDEGVAAEDFKAGQCDGVVITTLRARQFNKFMGSIDAIGAVPTYAHMRSVLQGLMGNPKVLPLTISGPYQIATITPIGNAYIMVRDRSLDTVEKVAGKKIAVMDWDKSQARMIQRLGAQAVPSDLTNFAGKFNNGQVDVIAAPAIVFRPLELYRGLGSKGAIFDVPLVSLTGSVVINRARLLEKVDDLDLKIEKIQLYEVAQIDRIFRIIAAAEKDIDAHYWATVLPEEKIKYQHMMREARISLTREGVYDPRMMSILKRVRCRYAPGDAECTQTEE
jgi:hypothetical protein